MQKRNVLNSPRILQLKKQRRNVFFKKIAIYLLGFVAIFAALAYISRLSVLNIGEIQVIGNKVVDSSEIKEVVQNNLLGNYLFFLPKTNILFYPAKRIEKILQNNFKRLDTVKLSIKDNKILKIYVSEKTAAYTWCGETIPESISDTKTPCYFLDKNGYFFDESPFFSGNIYFRFYGKVEQKDQNLLGSNFSPENFDKFLVFKTSLEKMGLKSVALQEKDGEIKIFLAGKTTLLGPPIIFDLDSDLESITENLTIALATEPLKSNFKNKYSLLQYIDLRFGNKVYYKFK